MQGTTSAGREEPALEERTIGGLHDFLMGGVLHKYARPGCRALDLGAGSGALALRLQALGLDVLAVDANAEGFRAPVRFLQLSLDKPDFASECGPESYDLVVSVEVIEHLESPIGFLRNVRRLLKPRGVAVITTPNVDNLPARVKFLLKGRVRMLDEQGDPTHISPIFWDLLTRQYLPRVQLELVEHQLFPPGGYKVTRARYAWAFRALSRVARRRCLAGDNHVLVLRPLS